MWGFVWLFWLMPLLILASAMRRRRWRRWAMMGPGWDPYGWQEPRGRDYELGRSGRGSAMVLQQELDEQRSYVDALESRITQLEERLDFTERLLAGRRETPPSPQGDERPWRMPTDAR